IRRIAPRMAFSRGDDPPEGDDSRTRHQPPPYHHVSPSQNTAPPTLPSNFRPHLKAIAVPYRPAKLRIVLSDRIIQAGTPSPPSTQPPNTRPRDTRHPGYLPARQPDWGP